MKSFHLWLAAEDVSGLSIEKVLLFLVLWARQLVVCICPCHFCQKKKKHWFLFVSFRQAEMWQVFQVLPTEWYTQVNVWMAPSWKCYTIIKLLVLFPSCKVCIPAQLLLINYKNKFLQIYCINHIGTFSGIHWFKMATQWQKQCILLYLHYIHEITLIIHTWIIKVTRITIRKKGGDQIY